MRLTDQEIQERMVKFFPENKEKIAETIGKGDFYYALYLMEDASIFHAEYLLTLETIEEVHNEAQKGLEIEKFRVELIEALQRR